MEDTGRTKLGRRALLAAGAGGVAAMAAEAVAPARVLGGSGNGANVQVGFYNDGTATTAVATTGNDGFRGQSDVGDGLVGETNGNVKSGVYGYSKHADGYGVAGRNIPSGATGTLGSKGQGVMGAAIDAEGVRGQSNNNFGVVGASGGKDRAGVLGQATNVAGFGVQGRNMVSHTYGYLGGQENGVYGASPAQGKAAVLGEHSDPTGVAVYGKNTAGNAVGGLGAGGTGVWGMAPPDLDHFGLAIIGRATFLTCSGLLTIAKNKSSVSATVQALSAGPQMPSMVLATLQTNRAGIYIQAAVASPATKKITVYLNKKVTAATKVAFFILN